MATSRSAGGRESGQGPCRARALTDSHCCRPTPGGPQAGGVSQLPPPSCPPPYLHPLGYTVQPQLREGLVEVELQPRSRRSHRAQRPSIIR